MSPTTSGRPEGRQCYADLLCQQFLPICEWRCNSTSSPGVPFVMRRIAASGNEIEVQLRYRRMDFYELNVMLERFSFDLKD